MKSINNFYNLYWVNRPLFTLRLNCYTFYLYCYIPMQIKHSTRKWIRKPATPVAFLLVKVNWNREMWKTETTEKIKLVAETFIHLLCNRKYLNILKKAYKLPVQRSYLKNKSIWYKSICCISVAFGLFLLNFVKNHDCFRYVFIMIPVAKIYFRN